MRWVTVKPPTTAAQVFYSFDHWPLPTKATLRHRPPALAPCVDVWFECRGKVSVGGWFKYQGHSEHRGQGQWRHLWGHVTQSHQNSVCVCASKSQTVCNFKLYWASNLHSTLVFMSTWTLLCFCCNTRLILPYLNSNLAVSLSVA